MIVARLVKRGFDALTASSADAYISEEKNVIKLLPFTKTPITVSGISGSVSVFHGKAFRPLVYAFLERSGQFVEIPSSDGVLLAYYDVTDTQVTFYFDSIGPGTYQIYWAVTETADGA